jgi:hypothetical protein
VFVRLLNIIHALAQQQQQQQQQQTPLIPSSGTPQNFLPRETII